MLLPQRDGGVDAPAFLADRGLLAAGALVATLVSHRRDWVDRHIEAIRLLASNRARREVTVAFKLPRIAWAMASADAPVLIPLALLPKEGTSNLTVEDEPGDPVQSLPLGESTQLAAAGLLALAQSVGADSEGLRRLSWQVAAGTPAEADAALAELARGRSLETRLAWMHSPFRLLAQRLAHHTVLAVRLRDADRPRALSYQYDEDLDHRDSPTSPGLYGWLSERAGWDGLHLRCPVPHVDDAAGGLLEIDAGNDAEVSYEIHDGEESADVRVTAAPTPSLRLAPFVALLGALLLIAESLAAPSIANRSTALSLVLLAPAAAAAYLARRPERRLTQELLHGWRRLVVAVAALCLAGQVVLALGASKSVVRPGAGVLALALVAVALLLFETRRRAQGAAPAAIEPRVIRAPVRRAAGRVDATRLAVLALVMAVGVMVVALGDAAARAGDPGARPIVWAGLVVIFVPAVIHAWQPRPRAEALFGVILMGLALYLVKVLNSPLGFTFHDELSTLRTTLDINRFGHLFAANPLIGVHPSYPALELVTSGVASITGLSTFTSGVLVLGAMRVALMASLFLVFESAVSTRVAALATVLYACNPNFVLFDSQWAYESFALPLALIVIAMAARGRRTAWLSAPIVLALSVTHPLTSIALIAFLVVWAAIDVGLARRSNESPRLELGGLALIGGVASAAWIVFVARGLGGYLGPVLGKAGNSMIDLLLGESGPKRIFGAAGVPGNPVAERVFAFASVLLALAAIVLGARPLWRRFTALGGALGLVALAYPVSLLLRLTEAGTEISNRASEFVFTGVALLGALALTERLPASWSRVHTRGRAITIPVVSALATITFIGGIVVGTAPWSRIPAHYRVVADETSVEPEGLHAASWARTNLGSGNRIFTDRINALLMGSIGLQDPQVGLVNGLPVLTLFTDRRVDDLVRSVIAADRIRYLVVDKRLSTGLPAVGFYFDQEEPGAYQHKHPLNINALVKFDTVCPIGRVFDSGHLVIYETRRLRITGGC